MATKKAIKKEVKEEEVVEVKEEFDPELPENKQRWLRT